MKLMTIIAIMAISFLATAQNYEWAKSMGSGTSDDYGRSVTIHCTKSTHIIPNEKSRLDDEIANSFEKEKFSLKTIMVTAGDVVIQGAQVLPSRYGMISLTHAAKVHQGDDKVE